jgi:hypothetical protein
MRHRHHRETTPPASRPALSASTEAAAIEEKKVEKVEKVEENDDKEDFT